MSALQDRGPARDGRRAGDPARRRPRGAVGRGARAHGTERLGQVDAVARAHGPRRLRGHRGLGHHRRRGAARPAHARARARAGCSSRCSTRSSCPACALDDFLDAAPRSGRATPTSFAAARRRRSRTASAWREQFLDRGVNVEFSGGEQKRAETLQLAVLRPEVRGARRDRQRPRRRRPARRRPPGRGHDHRGRPRRARDHPLRPAARRAPPRRRARPHGRPRGADRWPRAGRSSSRRPATRGSPPRSASRPRSRSPRPARIPFADPLGVLSRERPPDGVR